MPFRETFCERVKRVGGTFCPPDSFGLSSRLHYESIVNMFTPTFTTSPSKLTGWLPRVEALVKLLPEALGVAFSAVEYGSSMVTFVFSLFKVHLISISRMSFLRVKRIRRKRFLPPQPRDSHIYVGLQGPALNWPNILLDFSRTDRTELNRTKEKGQYP